MNECLMSYTMANVQPQTNNSSQTSSSTIKTSPSGPGPQAMVIVEPNSENHLIELFRVVEENVNRQNVVPLRQRNLPDSFFRPPSGSSSASHSRESSLDASSPLNSNKQINTNTNHSSGKPPTPIMAVNSPLSPVNNSSVNSPGRSHCTPPPGLPIIHQKAHSLPASLPQYKFSSNIINQNSGQIGPNGPLAVKPSFPSHNANHIHNRQQSYDINKIPLPEGWGMSYDVNTGERYFLDHKQKTTTWDDPRTTKLNQLSSLAQLSHSNPIMNQQANATTTTQPMAAFSSQPNINMQQVNPMNPMHHHLQQQTQINAFSIQQPKQTQQPTTTNNNNNNNSVGSADLIYQIRNNVGHQTSVNDTNAQTPNIPIEFVSLENSVQQTTNQQNNQTNQQYLIDLQMERKRLRQRQEEINKNPTMRSDYIPLQQQQTNNLDATITFLSRDNNNSQTMNNNNNNHHISSINQDVLGHLSTLNSCAINSSSNNGANFLNDFSFNRLNIQNITELPYDQTFQLPNSFDLESLDLIDDLDQLINSNNSSDLTQTINHDETMTWQV